MDGKKTQQINIRVTPELKKKLSEIKAQTGLVTYDVLLLGVQSLDGAESDTAMMLVHLDSLKLILSTTTSAEDIAKVSDAFRSINLQLSRRISRK